MRAQNFDIIILMEISQKSSTRKICLLLSLSAYLFEVRTCQFDDPFLLLNSDTVVIAIHDAYIENSGSRSVN